MLRLTRLLACLVVATPMVALADGPQLRFPSFEHLHQVATETVDITIGPWPLGIAAAFLDSNDPNDAEARELIHGLKAVYVRSYEFASDHMYSAADIEAVRRQLVAPDWNPLAQIHSHGDENVDIYVCVSHDKVRGLALVASAPRKFTILNVVGSIDPKRLALLEDRFGLPSLGR